MQKDDFLLKLAYSPCPNDTFMFNAIASGKLILPGFVTEVHLHDVETLNKLAGSHQYDITKLSIHAYLKLRESYTALNSGAALGFGCGPVVVCRKSSRIEDISKCSIAVPGELTTAHLLFQLWAPDAADRRFMPYDQIMDSVISGDSDAGIVIHEGRFTFEDHGLQRVVDLGEWWHAETGLPLPLGCIAARKSLGIKTITDFDALLKHSIELATAAPASAAGYIREHAQEMESVVLDKHIQTFVNEFSIDMGDIGWQAVQALEERALKAGIL